MNKSHEALHLELTPQESVIIFLFQWLVPYRTRLACGAHFLSAEIGMVTFSNDIPCLRVLLIDPFTL